MNIARSIPPHGHGLDCSRHWAALVEPIVPPENLDAPMSKNFVSALLECEGSVFTALAERRRPIYVASEEGFPAELEPIGDRLDALAAEHFPMRLISVSHLGQVRLELGFRQSFSE